MRLRVSVDAMGGDFGPSVVVPAVLEILQSQPKVSFLLCGDKQLISKTIGNKISQDILSRIDFRHAPGVVGGDEKPSATLRSKSDSSMAAAIRAVHEGDADACVSGGNTGALMALGLFILGVLPGVTRPAICSEIPTQRGSCLVLDLGANTDCSAEQLKQFALLGSLTAENLFSVKSPSVKLLNIGSESTKGNQMIQQTAKLLQNQSCINYQGFIEGDGLFAGMADVVVCDGFSGNIALKASEGTARLIGHRFSDFFNQDWRTRLVSALIGNRLSKLKLSMQPASYNGAYLLGLNAVLIKSHGGADKLGFKAALNAALTAAEHQLPSKLAPILKKHT